MKYFPLFIFSSCCCKSKWCVTNNPIIYQIILYFLFINQMMYSTNILIALFWGFTSLIFLFGWCKDVSTLQLYILRRTNVSWNIISCQDTISQTFPCFIFSLQRAMVVYVLFSNIYWKNERWLYELSIDKYSRFFWYTCLIEK